MELPQTLPRPPWGTRGMPTGPETRATAFRRQLHHIISCHTHIPGRPGNDLGKFHFRSKMHHFSRFRLAPVMIWWPPTMPGLGRWSTTPSPQVFFFESGVHKCRRGCPPDVGGGPQCHQDAGIQVSRRGSKNVSSGEISRISDDQIPEADQMRGGALVHVLLIIISATC